MLRRPNDHLLSIYHQCLQPGPLELHHRQKLGVAQGQPGFTLPDFATWVKSWKQDAPKQFYTQETMRRACLFGFSREISFLDLFGDNIN